MVGSGYDADERFPATEVRCTSEGGSGDGAGSPTCNELRLRTMAVAIESHVLNAISHEWRVRDAVRLR
jgi:hypothetical protein